MEDSIVDAIGEGGDDAEDDPRIPFFFRGRLEDQVNSTEADKCKTDMNFADSFLMLRSCYFVEVGVDEEGENGGQVEQNYCDAERDVMQADVETVYGGRIPKNSNEHKEEIYLTKK